MSYANNNIYIANYNAGTLQSMSTSTFDTTTISGGMYGVSGVAVDTNGNIFIANYNNNTISKIDDGSTTPVTISISNLYRPVQMSFDQIGNLYIANGNGTISIIPNGSTDTYEFLSFGTNGISGVGIDRTGTMFFTQDSNVYQVLPNTTTPLLYATGSVPLGAIAFENIPEPSTYALLLLSGVASLWALKRRKS
jgi:streptogramin lyase